VSINRPLNGEMLTTKDTLEAVWTAAAKADKYEARIIYKGISASSPQVLDTMMTSTTLTLPLNGWAAGGYDISVSGVNGYGAGPVSDTVGFNVQEPNGVKETIMPSNAGLQAFPNPAMDEVAVCVPQGREGQMLEVYNILGEKRGSILIRNGQETYHFDGLTTGTYVARVGSVRTGFTVVH
jgi:hypothetical protein